MSASPYPRQIVRALASVMFAAVAVTGVSGPAVGAPAPPAVIGAGSAAASTPPETDIVDVGDPSLAAEPQLSIAGEIRVVIVDEPGASRTEYAVATPSGAIVAITGDVPAGVTSGNSFAGTVAIPVDVQDALDARHDSRIDQSADDPIPSDSTLGEQVLQLADPAYALEIVAGEIDISVAAAATPRVHTVEVGISAGTVFSDAEVAALVADMNAYWASQSSGVIISVSRLGSIQRNLTTVCDADTVWNQAAARFGKSQDYYWDNGAGRHLVVLTDCFSGGLGSIGSQVHSGGLIWSSVSGDVDRHTLAHEFGHNVGLGHSNAHECTEPTRAEGTVSQGCRDYEYEDLFDVMSYGVTCAPPCVSTNKLGALNATHKRSRGFFPTGSLGTVAVSSTSVLQPASNGSGLRALQMTDPISGQGYVVEFRSGTGMDAGTFYAASGSPGYRLGIGVRVLATRTTDGVPASVAFSHTLVAGASEKRQTLAVNQSFRSAGGGLTVTVTEQSTTATVRVEIAGPSVVTRIQGADRYATAIAIARAGYTTAPVVYLATGANYPDALSAAPAATVEGGPLLLTPTAALPDSVRAAISGFRPTRVVVVGGTGAVSPAVLASLGTIPGVTTIDRIAGADRYATARAVVRYAFTSSATAYIATGANYPDALSAAAAGGAIGAPVVLVDGRKTSLDNDTRNLLTGLGVSRSIIAGGTSVVSSGIQASLAGISAVTRASGADRYATSRAINAGAFTRPAQVFLATGVQFPDALAGAALAGSVGAPLYVVRPTCVPAGIHTDIFTGGAGTVTLLGGSGALSPAVQALQRCP